MMKADNQVEHSCKTLFIYHEDFKRTKGRTSLKIKDGNKQNFI